METALPNRVCRNCLYRLLVSFSNSGWIVVITDMRKHPRPHESLSGLLQMVASDANRDHAMACSSCVRSISETKTKTQVIVMAGIVDGHYYTVDCAKSLG